jgi:diguanylate cyclase (GGDEF)-like protein
VLKAVPFFMRRPAQLSGSLAIEWHLIWIRWLGIIFVGPALWWLHLSPEQLIAAYAVLAAGAAYNGFIHFNILRRPGLFKSGYLTTVGDALLDIAMIILSGGFGTPLYGLMYTGAIASAMRYGYGPTGAVTVGVVALDFMLGRSSGVAPDGAFLIRSGFLLLTGILASFLRGQARNAETALQVQLVHARHEALHDRLTRLPNRAFLTDRLAAALVDQAAGAADALAVLCIDLDRFKEINDTVGHRGGDQVLQEVGRRMAHELPASAILARLSADEFAVLLLGADAASASETAAAILRALEQPLQVQDVTVDVSASVGIALAPDHGNDADLVLRRADIAMRVAKRLRGDVAVFAPGWDVHSPDRMQLAADLRRAVDRGELRLHYQPIVSLQTGSIEEVEALVRWQHPLRGLISPGEFIPLAEDTGLIVPIGRWVLEEACRQAVEWHSGFAAAKSLVMSVNLSARQFQHTDVPADVSTVLRATGLEPRALKLEITESVAVDDAEVGLASLALLKEVGVQLAIDDFGTGFSSLGYLKQIPADTLKIDKGFIDGLGSNPEDSAIVAAIIAFARGVGMSTTAEGVEQAEQLAHLRQLGADRVQGYYFSRPLPADQIEALFKQPRAFLDTPAPALLRAA